MWFILLPVLAPALFEGVLLTIPRKPRNQRGMAGCNALLLKCLGHLGDELEQCEACVDEALALAGLLRQGSYVVSGAVKESLEALRQRGLAPCLWG